MSQKEKFLSFLKNPASVQTTVDKIFEESDIDKSGFIERNEVKIMLTKIFAAKYKGAEPTEAEIDEAMEMIDTNKDEKISKEELTKVIKGLFKGLLKHA